MRFKGKIFCKVFAAAVMVLSAASCSVPVNMEIFSADVENLSLTGFRNAQANLVLEINNPSRQVGFSAISGEIKTPDGVLATLTGEDFTVLPDTCMKYRVPVAIKLDASKGIMYAARLISGENAEDLLIDGSLEYRCGRKAVRHAICKDMPFAALSDGKEMLKYIRFGK